VHFDSIFEPDHVLVLPLVVALPAPLDAGSDFIRKSDRLIQLHQQSIPVIHVKAPPTAYLLESALPDHGGKPEGVCMKPLIDPRLHHLSPDRIEMLVQIAREEFGDKLTRPAFTEMMLNLFEDIAGFETLSASKRRKYLNLLWLRYQVATGKK